CTRLVKDEVSPSEGLVLRVLQELAMKARLAREISPSEDFSLDLVRARYRSL
ncbi:hypothetical protein A2U01_0034058, partial [Trifolium medium]|nr:hypothetical protein [Trifolium medium]